MIKKFTCPVCKYDGLKEPPFGKNNEPSHEICPRCGFEFGFDGVNDPAVFTRFRQEWVKRGSKWFMPERQATLKARRLGVLALLMILSTSGFAQDKDFRTALDYKVGRLQKQFNLTDVQAAAIKPILKEYILKRSALLQEVEGQGIVDHVAVKETLNGLKDDERRKLAKILTQDQMQKWIDKENLMAALNPDNAESQVDDGVSLTANGADFKF